MFARNGVREHCQDHEKFGGHDHAAREAHDGVTGLQAYVVPPEIETLLDPVDRILGG